MMVTRMGSRVYSQELSFSDTRVTGGSDDGDAVFHSGYCKTVTVSVEEIKIKTKLEIV